MSTSQEMIPDLFRAVARNGLCTGCGACAALDLTGGTVMESTPAGPVPRIPATARFPLQAERACPGRGIHYPTLYRRHFGRTPERWLLGHVVATRTGYAADPAIRKAGASGGVLTRVLMHLLESRRVDAVVVVRQGLPVPEQARAVVVRTPAEVLEAAQSVYIPVSLLDGLNALEDGQRYAMCCLPDSAAALRVLQSMGHAKALLVKYVVGPYTGTALDPAAIRTFLRQHGVAVQDAITSLRWRAGDWPGYLEIKTASGRVLRSKKVYYNFLIPFFVTQNSLQNMDFANEFADLAVGDAWSPAFEAQGGGHSVITTRSAGMETILQEMEQAGLLTTEAIDPLQASAMHGHMLDFKKRGGYLRNRMRRALGRPAADFGMRPDPLPTGRKVVELVVSAIFLLARTSLARGIVARIPERVIGPVFNRLRLGWKGMSKPTKRKGLANLNMIETPDQDGPWPAEATRA